MVEVRRLYFHATSIKAKQLLPGSLGMTALKKDSCYAGETTGRQSINSPCGAPLTTASSNCLWLPLQTASLAEFHLIDAHPTAEINYLKDLKQELLS